MHGHGHASTRSLGIPEPPAPDPVVHAAHGAHELHLVGGDGGALLEEVLHDVLRVFLLGEGEDGEAGAHPHGHGAQDAVDDVREVHALGDFGLAVQSDALDQGAARSLCTGLGPRGQRIPQSRHGIHIPGWVRLSRAK
eukprot:584182-Hanusia_phi.AAC.1